MADMAVGSSSGLAQEQSFSETLRRIYILAFHPERWPSLQSDEAFEKARGRVRSILIDTFIVGQVLTIKSFVLLAIASPSYFDSTSCSLLTLAGYNGMIGAWLAILSMKFLTKLDRSFLKQGGFFLATYYIYMLTPMYLTTVSLYLFTFAILAAFISTNNAFYVTTVLLLVVSAVMFRTKVVKEPVRIST